MVIGKTLTFYLLKQLCCSAESVVSFGKLTDLVGGEMT